MKIDFFIIGVQKGGTTALYNYLRRSNYIQMARAKEVHFFDNEKIDWSNPDYARLHGEFDETNTSIKLRGEATPVYCYWPNALKRLYRYNSSAKLLMSLRHPSFRAYSHWRMEMERKRETLSFSEAINISPEQRIGVSSEMAHRVYSYVERGFYMPQIQNIFNLFPREQIMFLRTDKLWSDIKGSLERIQEFLGIEVPSVAASVYSAPNLKHDITFGIDDKSRELLDARFADDIRLTSSLTGMDLTDWLDPKYQEPMRSDG